MRFILNDDEYTLFKEYVDLSELNKIELNDDKRIIEIEESDLRLFQLTVSDASLIYGFDSHDEVTPLGRKLEALYDTIYYQSIQPLI